MLLKIVMHILFIIGLLYCDWFLKLLTTSCLTQLEGYVHVFLCCWWCGDTGGFTVDVFFKAFIVYDLYFMTA
jgi:hypothetical protein